MIHHIHGGFRELRVTVGNNWLSVHFCKKKMTGLRHVVKRAVHKERHQLASRKKYVNFIIILRISLQARNP